MSGNHNSATPRFNHMSLDNSSYLWMASFFKLTSSVLVRPALSGSVLYAMGPLWGETSHFLAILDGSSR
jgi:hypothetical protein